MKGISNYVFRVICFVVGVLSTACELQTVDADRLISDIIFAKDFRVPIEPWHCPAELNTCYSQFETGNECESGDIFVRFVQIDVDLSASCSDESGEAEGLEKCVYYGDPVAIFTFCCNGYLANRSTNIHDSYEPICCKSQLDSVYGKVDHSKFIDNTGTYQPGLILPPALDADRVICIEWKLGSQSSLRYLHDSVDGGTPKKYRGTVATNDLGQVVIYCNASDFAFLGNLELNYLNLLLGSGWISSSGVDCNDVSHASQLKD